MAEAKPDTERRRLRNSFREFVRLQQSGGIILLICAVAALIWANSPFSTSYFRLWDTEIAVAIGGHQIRESLLHWINDGLMAVFFFVVGLEIKREVVAGELASPRRAALPMIAAVGGMVVPAMIYASLNATTVASRGWGVPMATDIAFALAVLALLGSRVPLSLKVFLTSLAIVDDLGAILVIAVFYTGDVAWNYLWIGGGALLAMVGLNAIRVDHPVPYALGGLIVWYLFLQSGVHATVAGVLIAMTIPARHRIRGEEFVVRGSASLTAFEEATEGPEAKLISRAQLEALHALKKASTEVASPLQRLEHGVHPWATFLILPLFALANAGVTVDHGVLSGLGGRLGLGVILGLVLGKQLGITLFAWLACRMGLAALPSALDWRHIHGAAWLGGVGFTMSLFIGGLAFGEGEMLAGAKLAVLVASLVAGIGGYLHLRRAPLRLPAGTEANDGRTTTGDGLPV